MGNIFTAIHGRIRPLSENSTYFFFKPLFGPLLFPKKKSDQSRTYCIFVSEVFELRTHRVPNPIYLFIDEPNRV